LLSSEDYKTIFSVEDALNFCEFSFLSFNQNPTIDVFTSHSSLRVSVIESKLEDFHKNFSGTTQAVIMQAMHRFFQQMDGMDEEYEFRAGSNYTLHFERI
jgi:hypothetical protein